MEAPLTVLYSQAIRGDLALLPRLQRFLQSLRAEATGTVLLVDLGQSCDPTVWPCDLTGGRCTLLALDAMGYHAANVSGMAPESRARLAGQVTLALVDEAHDHVRGGVVMTIDERATTRGRPDDADLWLRVTLTPGEATAVSGGALTLAAVTAGQIGVAVVDGDAVRAEVRTLPPGMLPDPTIAGVVELVIEEARYFQDRQGR